MLDIIRSSWKKNYTKRSHYTDENRFNFYSCIIITNIRICCHKAEHDRIQMRVNCRSTGHCKENRNRLKVSLKMVFSYRSHINELVRIDKVKNIGTRSGKYRNCTIKNVIRFLMHKNKHYNKCNKFEDNGTNRNIGILFQRLVHPLHTNHIKCNRKAYDNI